MGINLTGDFRTDMSNSDVENLIVAGFLAISINRSQREGRSPEDAAKFGIGLYHGARPTIVDAQRISGDFISFSGVESVLKNGTRRQRDILNYINEVFDSR